MSSPAPSSASSSASAANFKGGLLLRAHVTCAVGGCTLPPPRAVGGHYCAVHRCIQCDQRKQPLNSCCDACLKRAAAAVDGGGAASSSSSASASLPSSLPWSHRCRHVTGETAWTAAGGAGEVGVPCGKPCSRGVVYCAVHLCSKCLGDCWNPSGAAEEPKPMYPCCTEEQCVWPRVAALQNAAAAEEATKQQEESKKDVASSSSSSSHVPDYSSCASPSDVSVVCDNRSVMLSVARVILHRLPERCMIYGGFVRDYLLRDEAAKDLDVVVCLPQVAPAAEQANANASRNRGRVAKSASEGGRTEADVAQERLALMLQCADALAAAVSLFTPPLLEQSRIQCPPSATSRDYLVVQVFAPAAGGKGDQSNDQNNSTSKVQVEYCVAGSYVPGEVDADINNLAVVSGCSLLPRDAAVPFSLPHALRHALAKQFAYVRQRGWKIGMGRLYKLLVEKGWSKVAKIPCVHPNETAEQLQKYKPTGEWNQPEWTVCPQARKELEQNKVE